MEKYAAKRQISQTVLSALTLKLWLLIKNLLPTLTFTRTKQPFFNFTFKETKVSHTAQCICLEMCIFTDAQAQILVFC